MLTKWYLDCVAENGDAVILYAADLRWNSVSFHYGSLLTVLNGKINFASALRSVPAPTLQGDILTVQQPGLSLEGTWAALRPPIRRTVFQNAQGTVDWHCLQPMSNVDLRVCGRTQIVCGRTQIDGLGYAECLTLSILPWHLPLTQLRWGRYLSQEDAVVWIDWQGAERVQLVLHNGEEQQARTITESEVVFAEGGRVLELDRGLVLRQGRLGNTVFRGISRLAKLLPRTMLAVDECKWRSHGVFRTDTGQSSGWAIHEVVKWKQ
ncbi:MAG TPA: hypothetical protein VFO46_09355 [Candidatus Sulfotelmatobacter sp.]|nr:hypothetical protein [Candidatus Sulfotelmatobacter sp.]